jgi:hypothetical protein
MLVTSAMLQTQQEVPTKGRIIGDVSGAKNTAFYVNGAATTVCSNMIGEV